MTERQLGQDRIRAELAKAAGGGTVRFETQLEASIDQVWSALTEPDQLRHWYGEVEGDLRRGGQFQLHVDTSGWDGVGRIDVCEPGYRIVVTTRESEESWRAGTGAPPFDAIIDATIVAEEAQTALILEVRGLPVDLIAFYGVGWQIHIEHLAGFLARQESGDAEARWTALLPRYQELAAHLD